MEHNARALGLFTQEDAEAFEGVNPAAWNLGIAAPALGGWAAARRAWPSLPHQVMPSAGSAEVVWCRRRSPAHAVISNVPLRVMCSECSHGSPGTGHNHPPAQPEGTLLGLAGRDPELTEVVEARADARPGVGVGLSLLR